MPVSWPLPTSRAVGDPGFVADINQMATNVNDLNARDAGKVPASLVDAKGDLLVGTAADTVGRLPVGANNTMLFADSSQASGLRWGAAGELPQELILDGVNVNSTVTAGLYFCLGTCTGTPVAGQIGHMEIIRTSGNQILQRFSLSGGSRIFIRRSVDNGALWGVWFEDVNAGVLSSKGSIPVGAGSGGLAVQAVGSDGSFLKANSTKTSGLEWVTGETTSALYKASQDLNTLVTPGFWTIDASATNRPALAMTSGGHVHVMFQATYVSQRYLTGTQEFFRTSSNGGSTWTSWIEVVTSDLGGVRYAKGTGFPEGAVTANVGSRYTDTAATNGAVEWIKASGTGNTGWRVVYGDTGRRNVSSLLLNGWSGGLYLARIGNVVWIEAEGLSPATATSGTVIDAIPGFYTSGSSSVRVMANTIATPPVFKRADWDPTSFRIPSYAAADGAYYFQFPLRINSASPWPSSLPGTAA